MEYMGGKEFWHQRFAARGDAPMQPEAILVEDMKQMQTGARLLDLACGDGRNALYLAQLGMQVEAVDFCPTALQRLNRFASRQNLCLHTKQMDLSDPGAVEQLGSYDWILCNHYRLSAAAADRLREHLLPEGRLWLNGFVRCPQDNPAIRPEDLLRVQDYEQAGYAVEDALEHTDAREHRYLRLILKPIQSKE
ncbi:MAG: methyltransferase domain-containing protein [Negativibacillus sp.]|nr:methyltransferase domain-containing protein [Negativibacillus sp.]